MKEKGPGMCSTEAYCAVLDILKDAPTTPKKRILFLTEALREAYDKVFAAEETAARDRDEVVEMRHKIADLEAANYDLEEELSRLT